jgi:hypothetical protein
MQIWQVGFHKHINLETEDFNSFTLKIQKRIKFKIDKH